MTQVLVRVQSVEPGEGYTATIRFTDGSSREVNLAPYLRGPIFEPIRNDPALFRAMQVEGGTIAWPNGADIDPDVLYYGFTPAWDMPLDEINEGRGQEIRNKGYRMDHGNAGDYETYQIALLPDLGITPEEFAQAWNEDAEAHDLATVHFAVEKVSGFIDSMPLLSIPASVASSTIYDLIEGVIERLRKEKGQLRPPHRHIHFEQTKKPDGIELIIAGIDLG